MRPQKPFRVPVGARDVGHRSHLRDRQRSPQYGFDIGRVWRTRTVLARASLLVRRGQRGLHGSDGEFEPVLLLLLRPVAVEVQAQRHASGDRRHHGRDRGRSRRAISGRVPQRNAWRQRQQAADPGDETHQRRRAEHQPQFAQDDARQHRLCRRSRTSRQLPVRCRGPPSTTPTAIHRLRDLVTPRRPANEATTFCRAVMKAGTSAASRPVITASRPMAASASG